MLQRYREYLRSERGLVPQGVVNYERVARLFLGSVAVAGAGDWSALSAGDVTRFMLEHCPGRGGSSARKPCRGTPLVPAVRAAGWPDDGGVGGRDPAGARVAGAVASGRDCTWAGTAASRQLRP